MTMTGVIWGPPGTGKTTSGIRVARGWYTDGARPEEVAYLSFTVAAAEEAASRIDGGRNSAIAFRDAYPLFRTIHSLAYMGLRKARPEVKVLTSADLLTFAKESGCFGKFSIPKFADEDIGLPMRPGADHWDRANRAYQIGRMKATTKDEMEATRRKIPRDAYAIVGFLEPTTYLDFIGRYEGWKQRNGFVDFYDMIEFALSDMEPLDYCKYVLVDEAQDCTPSMFAIIDRVFRNAEEVVWVGDVNQAIYGFSGAKATLLLARAKRARWTTLLCDTYRFGQEVADFSAKVIRACHERLDVTQVRGVPGKRSTIRVSGGFTPVVDERMILHRHVQGCREIAQEYINAGLPFRNERGRDPLGASMQVRGWSAIDGLAKGAPVPTQDAKIMLDDLIPSIAPGEGRLVVHGGKKKADKIEKPRVTIQDLVELKILTDQGAAAIREKRYSIMSARFRENLEYYEAVTSKGYSLESRWPVITTIHGSKGRQAKNVTLFNETSRRCWEDPDTEHRIAYVGSTRVQENLDICVERKVGWASVPYDYPEVANA